MLKKFNKLGLALNKTNNNLVGGDMLNKKMFSIIFAITLIALLSGSFIGYNLAPTYEAHKNPSVQWNVYAFKDGILVGEGEGNLITDIGETWLRDWAGCTAANTTSRSGAQYISLCNTASPLVTWTKLTSEVTANGFDRQAGTIAWWTNSGDSAFNVTKTFTATGTQQLQTAGLNWVSTGDSDNNLFAAAAFTQTTFNAGDTLTITWTITFDAN